MRKGVVLLESRPFSTLFSHLWSFRANSSCEAQRANASKVPVWKERSLQERRTCSKNSDCDANDYCMTLAVFLGQGHEVVG